MTVNRLKFERSLWTQEADEKLRRHVEHWQYILCKQPQYLIENILARHFKSIAIFMDNYLIRIIFMYAFDDYFGW